MKVDRKWRQLGWRNPHWDYVRFFTSFRKRTKKRKEWLEKLRNSVFEVEPGKELVIAPEDLRLFLDYIDVRDASCERASEMLRTGEEALAFCEHLKAEVAMTKTRLEGWADSPKAMVAAVTNIAKLVCQEKGISIEPNPQRRCLWLHDNDFTSRCGTSMGQSQPWPIRQLSGRSKNTGEGEMAKMAAAR